MAWNEPGNQNDDKNSDKKTGEQPTPPDLDRILQMIRGKIKESLQKGGNADKGRQGPTTPGGVSGRGIGLIAGVVALIVVAIWGLSGIFIISPSERAVILTFGKYSNTVGPGPHWIPPLIQTKDVVNVQQIDTYSYESQMLTRDENIVSVAVAVQYRISDPQNYLFNVVNPVESIKQATASALRQVIGNSTLDQILTTGREDIRNQVAIQLTAILDSYHAGIIVTDVALQPAKAPDEVKDAFDDAIKAQEDEQRYVNQAQAYAMGVEPVAKGAAARVLAAASGYQKQIVLKAQADVANYLALLPIYVKDPAITRERMYLDTMQDVLSKSTKIVVDTTGNNITYLPLGDLLKTQVAAAPSSPPAATVVNSSDNTSSAASGGIRPDRADLPNLGSRNAFTQGAQ